jgi:hypothetical protein
MTPDPMGNFDRDWDNLRAGIQFAVFSKERALAICESFMNQTINCPDLCFILIILLKSSFTKNPAAFTTGPGGCRCLFLSYQNHPASLSLSGCRNNFLLFKVLHLLSIY